MRNGNGGANNIKTVQPASKKGVKRLKPNKRNIGNGLLKKLEPTLPRKTSSRFISPYKTPQILTKTPQPGEIQNANPKGMSLEKPAPNQPKPSSATITKKPVENPSINSISESVKTTRKRIEATPSPAKIQPIDPFRFCEPVLNVCVKNRVAEKDSVLKRSPEEQSRVNHEVLMLIKSTAEAIKIIREQHEEWKNNRQQEVLGDKTKL